MQDLAEQNNYLILHLVSLVQNVHGVSSAKYLNITRKLQFRVLKTQRHEILNVSILLGCLPQPAHKADSGSGKDPG